VAPSLRSLYVADNKRGFRLDLADLADYEQGLKRALAKERETVKAQRLMITELRARSEVISLGGE
jgi:hypothetical protein